MLYYGIKGFLKNYAVYSRVSGAKRSNNAAITADFFVPAGLTEILTSVKVFRYRYTPDRELAGF